LAQLLDPFETLPAAFLTEDAFRYLAPGILRFLARSGEHYKVGDVLFHLENRLDGLTESQLSAVLNLLHLTYDRLQAEIEATPFDGACIRRIIDAIQRATEQGASTETYPDASPRRPAL
jgi:multidrug efflux pump subunit AcrA (membrane-fusion protein)